MFIGFRSIDTDNRNRRTTFSEHVLLPEGDFKIAFSVRVEEKGHIHLCDGQNPADSKCYLIILEEQREINETRTIMRRCESDIPEVGYSRNCVSPVAQNNVCKPKFNSKQILYGRDFRCQV